MGGNGSLRPIFDPRRPRLRWLRTGGLPLGLAGAIGICAPVWPGHSPAANLNAASSPAVSADTASLNAASSPAASSPGFSLDAASSDTASSGTASLNTTSSPAAHLATPDIPNSSPPQPLTTLGLKLAGTPLTPAAAEPRVLPLVPVPHWPSAPALGWDQDLWANRQPLITALDQSLSYLQTPAAAAAYAAYPAPFSRDRVRQSLRRFRTLLQVSQSPEAFHRAVQREFMLYQTIGNDGAGTVHFTGYFEPLFQASRTPTTTHRYPLYRRPPDLDTWPLPHPRRVALEGVDGLQGGRGPLAGLELVWLGDRLEAFLVQVQGSARLQLTDGSVLSVGYAGRTEYPYTSLGRELINDGIIPAEELTLDRLLAYFEAHPEALNRYIPRNDRFIFFRPTDGGPPSGSLSVPVTPGRSIATDKSLMPPGALALITLDWPEPDPTQPTGWQQRAIARYVLDQDTGGAILGPGRVDIFVGSGPAAGAQAGQINTDGALYYLLLRP